jgi:peptidoglycan/LPS O-acetylase OafA/YrhL
MPPSPERALEIDGIRGWASFFVLVYHECYEMLNRLVPWLNSAWFAPIFDGRIAVCVFFVLSGDALSTAFLSRGGKDPVGIDRLLVRRYTRLTIPILLSAILVYVLRLLHADFHQEGALILERTTWLGQFVEFPFSVIGLVRFSLMNVYIKYSIDTSYNPFLWTMSVEMIGSMLIFLMCYLWPRVRNPKAMVAGVAILLFGLNSYFCLFFAGMFLGLLRTEGFYAKKMGSSPGQWASLAGFVSVALLLVAGYRRVLPLFYDFGVAIAVVFLLYSQRRLRNFLRGPLSRWLGDVSFPIYLVQFAVMMSFESWLATVWSNRQLGTEWVIAIGLSSVAVTLLVGWLFRHAERVSLSFVDARVLRLLRKD